MGKGYSVSTVEINEEIIRRYVESQEEKNRTSKAWILKYYACKGLCIDEIILNFNEFLILLKYQENIFRVDI